MRTGTLDSLETRLITDPGTIRMLGMSVGMALVGFGWAAPVAAELALAEMALAGFTEKIEAASAADAVMMAIFLKNPI